MMFILIDNIIGNSILDSSIYNSYELQARAWLHGNTFLERNYLYLELAIYNGHFFVSFPPFPSIVLLPFVLIFPNGVPSNLISFFLFALQFVLLYKILKSFKTSEFNSIMLALSLTVGSNLLFLSIDSGVWFFAQLLNNVLCLLAIKAFLNNKKMFVYLCLGLAVGCRPFSALYMIMFFIYYLVKEKDTKVTKRIINNIKPVIPTIFIAGLYMWYNYIRFDNILEFGHNYLPEFINSQYGQFNSHYLLPNLKALFFNFVHIDNKLHITFDWPFSFFIANPAILLFYYRCFKNVFKIKKVDRLRVMIFASTLINIIFICMHDTLGAVQFGARYACDILPFIFLGIIWYKNSKKKLIPIKLDRFEIFLIIFGIILNIFGAITIYKNFYYFN